MNTTKSLFNNSEIKYLPSGSHNIEQTESSIVIILLGFSMNYIFSKFISLIMILKSKSPVANYSPFGWIVSAVTSYSLSLKDYKWWTSVLSKFQI